MNFATFSSLYDAISVVHFHIHGQGKRRKKLALFRANSRTKVSDNSNPLHVEQLVRCNGLVENQDKVFIIFLKQPKLTENDNIFFLSHWRVV